VSYTSVHLDHDKAKKKLEKALAKAVLLKKPASRFQAEVSQVILGSHLTYRYILITNLLAKATNKKVNALVLQVGADSNGAFDSRSLCHKVFVPFEREKLGGKLGRSNEPYLNKPARHKTLSSNNAVRRGNDRDLLNACIHVLSKCTQSDAETALIDALFFTLRRRSISDSVVITDRDTSVHAALEQFASNLLTSSNEGESCALLTGLAFHLLSYSLSGSFDIRVHPVNQSGASSKEVLDVDVYSKKELRFVAEVKDKEYFKEDVDHAANKVKIAGHDSMFFLEGPNASTALSEGEIVKIGQKHGVRISVVPVKAFFMAALGLCPSNLDMEAVWATVTKIAQGARLKQVTIDFIQGVAAEVGIVE